MEPKDRNLVKEKLPHMPDLSAQSKRQRLGPSTCLVSLFSTGTGQAGHSSCGNRVEESRLAKLNERNA